MLATCIRRRRPSASNLLLATFVAVAGCQSEPVRAEDGRSLFERGVDVDADTSTSPRQLSARAGADGSWVLRGPAVACANCHGLTGAGGGEGYLRAPDLRWPQWSSTDEHVLAAARSRLRTALAKGRSADGRQLAVAMPRFDLDDAQFEALSQHLRTLTVQPRTAAKPTLALLRMRDAGAPAFEQEVHRMLTACLTDRLKDRATIEVAEVSDAQQATRQWVLWQKRPEVVAVLAPPWRGWRPSIDTLKADGGPLTALFPIVSDPDASSHHLAQWLFGGVLPRTAALVQTWMLSGTRKEPLWVWSGPGERGATLWSALNQVAAVIEQDTGRRPSWRRLPSPILPNGQAGLWLDEQQLPGPGWWLVPVGVPSRPGEDAKWWMASPYPGAPARGLTERWAEATCMTTAATLTEVETLTRDRWSSTVGRTGRLRDKGGWEWHVPPDDPEGYGASAAWTVVEFRQNARPIPVSPQVNVGRPRAVASDNPPDAR